MSFNSWLSLPGRMVIRLWIMTFKVVIQGIVRIINQLGRGQSPLEACLWVDVYSPASFRHGVFQSNTNPQKNISSQLVFLSVRITCSAELSVCDFSGVTDNSDTDLSILLLKDLIR